MAQSSMTVSSLILKRGHEMRIFHRSCLALVSPTHHYTGPTLLHTGLGELVVSQSLAVPQSAIVKLLNIYIYI